ncbi:MAG: molybdopterin molybdenumtransferase MoeA [Gammaproteobacteria bacterium HGW-Gammaproteobacteria-2]|jgi:molybdopterin molybdotransferase|nr:MAG: molybdopterin molybdenumtransferase MoeA [Gammaproteobacteria bacterium HGW-Gammaproteobacteria-2]
MRSKHEAIGFSEALAIVREVGVRQRLPTETVAINAAAGRVLAETIIAAIDLPGFDNSAMDGFAVRAADLNAAAPSTLRLADEQFAGIDRKLVLAPATAIRITTGAPLPAGADTVVIKENASVADGYVTLAAGTTPGANIRRRGEDLRSGELAISAASRLLPAQASLAAALGFGELLMYRRPRVAVFSGGDELRQPGQALAAGEIYDSNHALVSSLLAGEGISARAFPSLPDDPLQIRAALADAGTQCDLLITCGGVSAGEKDYLPALIAEHGEWFFWKVRIKPGMPVLFGRFADTLVMALPGNPVAVLATFRTLVVPLLDALQGIAAEPPALFARLSAPLHKKHSRFEFQRGRVYGQPDGCLWVDADPATGSNRLAAAARANALLCIPEGPQQLALGDAVQVLALGGW